MPQGEAEDGKIRRKNSKCKAAGAVIPGEASVDMSEDRTDGQTDVVGHPFLQEVHYWSQTEPVGEGVVVLGETLAWTPPLSCSLPTYTYLPTR